MPVRAKPRYAQQVWVIAIVELDASRKGRRIFILPLARIYYMTENRRQFAVIEARARNDVGGLHFILLTDYALLNKGGTELFPQYPATPLQTGVAGFVRFRLPPMRAPLFLRI